MSDLVCSDGFQKQIVLLTQQIIKMWKYYSCKSINSLTIHFEAEPENNLSKHLPQNFYFCNQKKGFTQSLFSKLKNNGSREIFCSRSAFGFFKIFFRNFELGKSKFAWDVERQPHPHIVRVKSNLQISGAWWWNSGADLWTTCNQKIAFWNTTILISG